MIDGHYGDEDLYPQVFFLRFERRVDRSGGPDACWPWTGPLDAKGRGKTNWHSMALRPHQVAWWQATGDRVIGYETCLHHTCELACCCNPAHLEVLTRSEHMALHNAKRY